MMYFNRKVPINMLPESVTSPHHPTPGLEGIKYITRKELKWVMSSLGNYDEEKELECWNVDKVMTKETRMGFLSIFQGHEYKRPFQNINSFVHIKINISGTQNIFDTSPCVYLWDKSCQSGYVMSSERILNHFTRIVIKNLGIFNKQIGL